MSIERMNMKLLLAGQRLEGPWNCRPVTKDDIPALARLVLDAYRDTIDDEGETLDDALRAMQDTFAGTRQTGALLESCSFVIEEWGEPLACTLVTWWHEQPLLAYVMAHPTARNRGMGRFLIQKSINALLAQGHRELSLFVTKGNLPAQHLYERLGFQVMSTVGSADVNGTKLYYEVAGAGVRGAGEGHPLVWLHSGLTNNYMWDAQWQAFTQRYRVIRCDLRGFGWSGAASGSFSYREDLYHLLRFLGIKRAYLVGSSMGGSLAIDFALEHPEMVAALIPVGAGVSGEQPSAFLLERWKEIDAAAEGGDLAQAVELELQLWVDGPGRAPEQVNPAVREQVRQMNTENFARSEQEQGQPQPLEPPAVTRLGAIRVPTLVLVGEHDVPDKLASAELLARSIPGAQKAVIAGAAHLPSMEQPEQFNRLVLEFLGNL
ncbi:MAG TPA: alpha/beta fold hydrolase [Ktedonobacterales bacterium]|nr:alpha/beta fold hydrolase [Ktedonobacterales bacterium]